jgi:Tol biopolymer transport system component
MRDAPLRSGVPKHVVVLLATVVLLSLLVGAGAAGSARTVKKNGKFSFAGLNETIWVMNANGSGKKALTRHVASDNLPGLEDSEPEWSPNGTTILFTRSRQAPGAVRTTREIWVMNANGSNQTRLTRAKTNDYSPSWSPDGKRITFVRDRRLVTTARAPGEIYVMKANGTGITRLTESTVDTDGNTAIAASEPAWSPDGTKIAYTSQGSDIYEYDGVYAMNADGSGQRRLSREDLRAAEPTWSPDSSKIAFKSENLDLPSYERGFVFEIYVMNADGSGLTRLTQNDGFSPYGRPNEEVHLMPAWSPDGTKIAFVRYITGKTIDQKSLYDLFVMNADGSNQTRLARDIIQGVDWGPVPTGRPNPLPPPPRTSVRPSLRLRCLNHVPAVPGHVFEALVAPSAGIRSVKFYLNRQYVYEASIPPLFIRMQVALLPKNTTWKMKAVVTVVANEAQTAWAKQVLTKSHAPNC